MQTFGQTLSAFRINRQLLVKDLAERVGVDASQISLIEKGRKQPPRGDLLQKIIQALDLPPIAANKLRASASLERARAFLVEIEGGFPITDLAKDILALGPDMSDSELHIFRSLLWTVKQSHFSGSNHSGVQASNN